MGDRNDRGLVGKFLVERADGRDQPGGDRYGARYFVLDIDHDPFAGDALRAYAAVAHAAGLEELATDLDALVGPPLPTMLDRVEAAKSSFVPAMDGNLPACRPAVGGRGCERCGKLTPKSGPREACSAVAHKDRKRLKTPTERLADEAFLDGLRRRGKSSADAVARVEEAGRASMMTAHDALVRIRASAVHTLRRLLEPGGDGAYRRISIALDLVAALDRCDGGAFDAALNKARDLLSTTDG